MRRRLTGVAAIAAGLLFALAGCGSDSASSGGSTQGGGAGDYRVVVLGGISAKGVLADNASTSVLAAKARIEFANRNGGVGGRKVTVDVIDDQGDPTTAVTRLREAIAKKKPDLVLNSGPSTVAEATLPILKQNSILSMNIGPTQTSADPKQFPLNFDLSPVPTDYLGGFVPYLQQHGYKKLGILHGSSSYGETFGKGAQDVLSKEGFDVVKNEEYDIAALDMTAQLEAVRAGGPDALVLDAYGAPLGYILDNVQKLGWNVPIVANSSVAATGLISSPPPSGVLGTPAVKNLVMQVFKSTKYDPNAVAVNDAVTLMKGLGSIKATLILAYNYDALPLVMAAAAKAGSTDAKAIATALEQPDMQQAAKTAILARYNYTASSHAPSVGKGEFIFIAPSERRDGQYH